MPPEPADSHSSLFAPGRRALAVGAIALCSMLAFEAIGVAAAMPAIALALDGLPNYALAFASASAASLVGMVMAGQCCDRSGPRTPMLVGLLLFALGLLASGAAADMRWMLLGRLLQGVGIGMLGVVLYVAVARGLPVALHPRLFALFSSAWVVPALVGPALAGLIVDQLGWRWLFFGVAALLLPTAWLMLPSVWTLGAPPATGNAPPRSTRALPWSILAAAAALGLHAAGRWAPLWVAGSLLLAVLAASRLLPPGTLRLRRGLASVIALRGLLSAAFFLSEAFIPLWLQLQQGWSTAAAGAALSSGALSWSAGSQLQSRLQHPDQRQRWLQRGCWIACAGIVLTLLAVLRLLPAWSVLGAWTLTGLGVGLALPMLGVLTLKLSTPDQQGANASALQLSAALATSIALALGGLLFAHLHNDQTPALGYAAVMLLAATVAAVAAHHAARVQTPAVATADENTTRPLQPLVRDSGG